MRVRVLSSCVVAITAVISAWIAPSLARADALPPPGRPEWPDTPLPMPDDPPALAAWCVVFALALTMMFWATQRRSE